MKLFTRTASAFVVTGVLFASATALAAPAKLIAQTTVPTQGPVSSGQKSFEAGLKRYNLNVEDALDVTAIEGGISNTGPACIAGCLPLLQINQNF